MNNIITNFWIILGIVYLVCFLPSLRIAIAFWLYKDKDEVAYLAMKHGFLLGLLSIWVIYPFYIINEITKRK